MTRALRLPPSVSWSGERRRRGAGAVLAMLLLTLTHLPGMVALAAPQYFSRAGAGVSNIPLEVMAFSGSGFGEVSDAINLATGNVYLDMGVMNRNNLLAPTDDKRSASSNLQTNGIKRLAGFSNTNGTVPAEWSIGLGDGSYQTFRRATDAEINASPSWIAERYAGIRSGVAFYITKPQDTTQVDEQWLVFYQTTATDFIAHHYDHSGNRTTFYRDGQYTDYLQTPAEQYLSARDNNDPDGRLSGSRRTEFTYSAPGNGHISRVEDAWGRRTDYTWNESAGYITYVGMLRQSDGTYAREINYDVGYISAQSVGQYVISGVKFTTLGGRGGKVYRNYKFEYRTQNRWIPVASAQRDPEGLRFLCSRRKHVLPTVHAPPTLPASSTPSG